MRKSKACVGAETQALDKLSPETSMLVLGKAATAFAHSNQLVAYQALTKEAGDDDVSQRRPRREIRPLPQAVDAVEHRRHDQENAEEAARIVNFYVADPDGARAIGAERGVPASARIRSILAPELDELGKAMVDYISFVSDKVGELPPPPPKGAGEIQFVLKRVNGGDRLRQEHRRRRGAGAGERIEVHPVAGLRHGAAGGERGGGPSGRRTGTVGHLRDSRAGYGFLAPWLAGFFLLNVGPTLASLVLSFTNFDLIQAPRWVGTANYVRIATVDTKFWTSLQVTFLYVLMAVPFKLVFALAVAMALNKGIRGLPLYRAVFYLPSLLGECRHRRPVAQALRRRRARQPDAAPRRHQGTELDLQSRLRRSIRWSPCRSGSSARR